MASRHHHTASMPLLSLKTVNYSLTEGTSIPAPAPDTPPSTPPTQHLRPQAPVTHGGPLSSHPVTPDDSDEGIAYFPPVARSTTRLSPFPELSAYHPTRSTHTLPLPTTSPPASTSQYSYSQPQGSLPHGEDQAKASRRPSIAQRFLRLRSFSSLRSTSSKTNASSTSLARSSHTNLRNEFISPPTPPSRPSTAEPQTVIHTYIPAPRGTKRAAESSDTSSQPRSTLRRKSMDLLNSARRASGLWNRDVALMLDGKQSELNPGDQQENVGPAPQVQLHSVDTHLGGEELFSRIGR